MNQVLTCWSPMQRCPTQWAGRKIGLSILKSIKWQRTNKILLCDNSLFQQKDQQRRWIVYHCRLKADHRLLREPRLLIQAIVCFFGPSAISWPGGKTKSCARNARLSCFARTIGRLFLLAEFLNSSTFRILDLGWLRFVSELMKAGQQITTTP